MHGPTGETGIVVAMPDIKLLEETMSPIDVVAVRTGADELQI